MRGQKTNLLMYEVQKLKFSGVCQPGKTHKGS